jgi:hypothetical protein
MTAEEARSLVLTLHRIVSNGGGAQHRPAAGAWYFENRVELEDDEPTVQAATKTAPATPQPLAGQPMKSKSLREVTVRALTSRQQIDRVGHHLSNCLSQYWSKVKSGQTWIYSVEINGKPTEVIEVHPVTRKVLQWKGVKNSAPNDKTKSVLAKELVSAGVLNANSLGG